MFIENLARMRQISLESQWHDSDDVVGWFELERLQRALIKYKEKRKIIDYTDMLVKCLEKKTFPKLRILFVDEAQDLSSLQWDMVRQMWKDTDKTYIAGDDDQAIFKWAGADVDHFISLKKPL